MTFAAAAAMVWYVAVTIAFAWELGANLGHLSRGSPLAQRLQAQGFRTIFAVRDIALAHSLPTAAHVDFVAAPRYKGAYRSARPPINYSELLAECGYLDPLALRALVRAWIGLWRTIDPAVVVIDHSPTALLAARVLRVPAVLIGTGFTIPPGAGPMPSMRPGMRTSAEELRAADEKVRVVINQVLEELDHPPLSRTCSPAFQRESRHLPSSITMTGDPTRPLWDRSPGFGVSASIN